MPDVLDEVYGSEPTALLGSGAFFRPESQYEQAPMPVRNEPMGPSLAELQQGRGQQLDELDARLSRFVQEGRMRPEHARQVMAAHEADLSPFAASAGPGVDVGGLTPAQAMERVRQQQPAAPAVPPAQQMSPQEAALVSSQRDLQNARLGPSDRVKMQELANSLRQIQQGVAAGQIYPVDAHNMWQQVYPELQALQAREARVPLLEARAAAMQLQQQHAVASTVEQQHQAFGAANAQSRVHTVTLLDGTTVQLMKDDRGVFHPLHDQPIQGIPQGFRNEQEIAQTIRQRQQEFIRTNQNLPARAGTTNRYLDIAQQVRNEANHHRTQATQAAREARLGDRANTPVTPHQQSSIIHEITSAVNQEVERQLSHEHRSATARNAPPAPPRPEWMRAGQPEQADNATQRVRAVGGMQGNVQAEIDRRVQQRFQQLGIQPAGGQQRQPGAPNPATSQAIEALRSALLRPVGR